MKRRMWNLKWMVGVAAVMVLLLSVPTTTEAGRRYSGADPIFMVAGYQVNVQLEVPSDKRCDLISGDLPVHVQVPKNWPVEMIAESKAELPNCGVTVESNTTFEFMDIDGMSVSAYIPSQEDHEVKVKVHVNGELFRVNEGMSNTWVSGDPITGAEVKQVEAQIEGFSDNSLDADLTYSYEETPATETTISEELGNTSSSDDDEPKGRRFFRRWR